MSLNAEQLKTTVINWAGTDEARRNELYNAPKATIEKILNQQIPDNLHFLIKEDTCSTINIVLQPMTDFDQTNW